MRVDPWTRIFLPEPYIQDIFMTIRMHMDTPTRMILSARRLYTRQIYYGSRNACFFDKDDIVDLVITYKTYL